MKCCFKSWLGRSLITKTMIVFVGINLSFFQAQALEKFKIQDDATSGQSGEVTAPAPAIVQAQEPPVEVNQCTNPPVYFKFRSANFLNKKIIQDLARKHCGNDIDRADGKTLLLGADQGFQDMVNLLASKDLPPCVQSHVYLEGPGGPTGSGSLPTGTECKNMQNGARRAGLSGVTGSCAGSQAWMKEWNKSGYRKYTRMQIEDFAKRGFRTYEIDNEYRDPSIGTHDRKDRSQGLVNFYVEQQKWVNENPLFKKLGFKPKMVLKNLNAKELRAIKIAVDDKLLDPSFFAGYLIIEEYLDGQKREISAASAEMGIQTVTNPTGSTYSYAAEGAYRVGAKTALCKSGAK